MAIVYRNGRPYLYRSIRRGGRVASQYLGRGEDALLIDALETIERDEKDYQRHQERRERQQLDDLEQSLDELAEQARTLAGEALISAGYHQHHRGEWRKRRGKRRGKGQTGRTCDGLVGEVQAHRLCSGQGSHGSARRKDFGERWTKKSKNSRGLQQARLSEPSPKPRLSHGALRLFEATYVSSSQSEDGITIKQAEFHLRRIDRAHRRLLSSLKTLATIRRLALPALQINVASQQVNQLNAGGSS